MNEMAQEPIAGKPPVIMQIRNLTKKFKKQEDDFSEDDD